MSDSRYFDILRYWRNSLADADRMNFTDNLPTYAESTLQILESGQIPLSQAETLIEIHQQNNPSKPIDEIDGIPVVVCPLIIRPMEQRGVSPWKYKDIVTLWIPAKLSSEGRLYVDDEVPLPWIPRDFLDPNDRDQTTVGSVDALDRYHTLNRQKAGSSWAERFEYANCMLNAVTGRRIEKFTLKLDDVEYIMLERSYVLPQAILVGMSAGIIFLYDTLLKHKRRLPLLERFTDDDISESRPLLTALEELEAGKHHLGQMNNKFGLSPSQRESLAHFFTQEAKPILAVNGPPGTGKTTLLQSVVASLWVSSALADDGIPPVIVAASTNNQAVTNVIKDFGSVAGLDVLSRRWLPKTTSYGLYCASKEKSKDTPFLTLDDFPKLVESFEFLDAAETSFAHNYTEWAHASYPGIAESIQELQKLLKRVVTTMHHGIDIQINLTRERAKLEKSYGRGGVASFITKTSQELEQTEAATLKLKALQREWDEHCENEPWWMTLFLMLPPVKRRRKNRNEAFFRSRGIRRSMDFAEPEQVSADLDGGIVCAEAEIQMITDRLQRAKLDQASYEHAGRLLLDWGERNNINTDSRFNDDIDKELRYQAFCLAAHIWEGRWLVEAGRYVRAKADNPKYSVPEIDHWRRYAKLTPCFVSTFHKLPYLFFRKGPLWEGIDLLIIDEAGQVSPEVAGASLAFAKRALIVGDVLQIEPVWSVPKSIDHSNMRRYNVATTEESALEFSNSGRAVSNGSVMQIAQRQSAYKVEGQFGGMMLVEHRRCVPEIIDFCNHLAYKGLLLPKRPPFDGCILPHWGHLHIPGKSEKLGSSLVNRKEALAIVDWIVQNRQRLEGYYRTASSSPLIGDLVAVVTPFAAQANVIRRALSDAGIASVKAGTIHVLQGAERHVVIFSPVYCEEDKGEYFFNKKLNLLNVAVSRAKDSFIVIGDLEILKKAPKHTFTGVLASYLLRSEQNDISGTFKGPEFSPRAE